jgi:hypothetical protein
MTTAATTLLGLALPVTGELSGTWGDTVNTAITALLDSAIAGTTTLNVDADITLSTTTLAANESREAIILWTAGGTVTRNVTAPAQSKTYIVINKTSSSQSIVIRGAGPTTGVTVIAGEYVVCAWNGSDFVKVASNTITQLAGVLAVAGGGTGQSSYTIGDLLYASGATTLSKLADIATGNALISGGVGVAPSYGKIGLTTHVSGALPVANGGTNATTAGITAFNNITGNNLAGVTGNPNTSLVFSTTPSLTSPTVTTSIISGSTTFALLNTTATTLNIGGAATTITIGAATGTLTVANTTLAAKAITASTTLGVTGVSTLTGGATIQGLTVGLGAGAVASNTAVGANALSNNVSGSGNIAVGQQTGTAITTGSGNIAVGYQAGSGISTGTGNIAIGYQAAGFNSTGSGNIAVGYQAGSAISTGSNNVIIGGYTGSAAPISATGSSWVVLSDGAGNVRQAIDSAGNSQFLTGAVVVYAPAPTTTISALTTLTNAQLQPGIVETSGTSFTLTMPLGTTLDTLVTWAGVDLGFDFSVINTASGTITMAVNTGVTFVGTLTVLTGISARFRIRRTAASTYIVYRIA